MTPYDPDLNPYLALGLQANPFVLKEQPGVPEGWWIDQGWSQAPAPRAKQLVQVMGPKGFGKTSHLKHWQGQTGGPYCYYPPGWGRLQLPPVRAIAYWDEADRIPLPWLIMAFGWAALTQATLCVGTHQDLAPFAHPLGLSVTTIELPPLRVNTLLAWSTRRIASVRIPGMPPALSLSPEKAAEIVQTAQGSWRDAADELHIWAAETARP